MKAQHPKNLMIPFCLCHGIPSQVHTWQTLCFSQSFCIYALPSGIVIYIHLHSTYYFPRGCDVHVCVFGAQHNRQLTFKKNDTKKSDERPSRNAEATLGEFPFSITAMYFCAFLIQSRFAYNSLCLYVCYRALYHSCVLIV